MNEDIFNNHHEHGDSVQARVVEQRLAGLASKEIANASGLTVRAVLRICRAAGCPFRISSITHGRSETREYSVWTNIKTRCFSEKCHAYMNYGGRGITMCDRWRYSFKAFLDDVGYAPDGMSLDRNNNDKGYEPGNCAWATRDQQNNNRRDNPRITYEGITLTIAQWAKRMGMSYGLVKSRFYAGHSPETIFSRKTANSGSRLKV